MKLGRIHIVIIVILILVATFFVGYYGVGKQQKNMMNPYYLGKIIPEDIIYNISLNKLFMQNVSVYENGAYVSAYGPTYIAMNRNKTELYVLGSKNILVINASNYEVVGDIKGVDFPTWIQFSPIGNLAYVTDIATYTLIVINTTTNKVVMYISLDSMPVRDTITPDGRYVYVPEMYSNEVVVVNSTNNSISDIISSLGPTSVAIDGYNNYAYITEMNGIQIVNTESMSNIKNISMPQYTEFIYVSPDNKSLYVTSAVANTISVINASLNKIVAVIPMDTYPVDVAFTPDSKFAYVSRYESNTISIINMTTMKVEATMNTTAFPNFVTFSENGNRAYLLNEREEKITVIKTGVYN